MVKIGRVVSVSVSVAVWWCARAPRARRRGTRAAASSEHEKGYCLRPRRGYQAFRSERIEADLTVLCMRERGIKARAGLLG